MKHRILVINPGSTSTKIAVFEGKEKLFDTTLRYSTEELASFGWVMEQVDFRRATIEKALADNNIDPDSLDAICARGGQVPYCAAGTYRVDQAMVDFMYTRRQGAHASNLGCVLALLLAKPLGIPAYIVDPVMVDEMDDVARVSGLPELPRKMQGHALNCRAMAIRCADEVLHKPLADCRLIVLHLGGGGSCRLFVDGRMVDCVRDDEWMKDCHLWLYRGAWMEWDLGMVDMAVPLSPDELIMKRHAIYRHLSQKDIMPFPGSDPREFWQRAEERTQNTAKLYDQLGMAEYQAIEVFVKMF